MPLQPRGLGSSGQSKANALCNSVPSECAVITHPFHPFRGERFPILKTRRVSGKVTLILQGSILGTFGVPQEWTDQGCPLGDTSPQDNCCILDFQCLLALREVVQKLDNCKKKQVD